MIGVGIGVNRFRRIGGGGGAAPYTLLDDPGLLLWGDVQADVTTSGGELTAWEDQLSAQAIDPPTVTARPLYNSDQINSLPVLTFRGSDPNYLDIDTSTWGADITLYFVLNITTSQQRRQFFAQNIGSTKRCRIDNDGAGNSISGFGSLIEVRKDNVLAYIDPTEPEMDNVLIGNSVIAISKLDFTSVNALRIGCSSALNQGINGIIADIAATQGATNLTENNNFLMTKYGLS